MNSNEGNKSKGKIVVIASVIIALIVGFWGGNWWNNQHYTVVKAEGFDQLQVTYDRIMNVYLNGAESSDVINGAIKGMVSSLGDKYSQFLPEEEGEQYAESYDSNFVGIGAEVRMEDNKYLINSLIKDTPAEKSGLKPDDQIVAIDNQSIEGLTLQELVALIRGEKGTTVTLSILRGTSVDPVDYAIVRDEIPVYTVSSEMLDNGIGKIVISRFSEPTDKEFIKALDSLRNEGELKGLVLDMRANPGGLLNQTINIADLLIPKDKKILDVVYKDEKKTVSFVSDQEEPFNIPIAVLINEYSASASEVLTAALKESAGAYVVGKTSYGKGVVQTYQQFDTGSVLVLTEAQWKTPDGEWIHEVGVEPTHEVDLPQYASLTRMSAGLVLELNSYGDDVLLLQKLLDAVGYKTSQNGLFDKETQVVLKQYQQATGLTVNGIYTDEVGNQLVADIQAKLVKEDYQLQKAIDLLIQK